MTAPPITDHVFRPVTVGRHRGQCAWLGGCERPAADHPSVAEFWWRRRAR